MDEQLPIAVIDIDGVVADVRHRLHHISHRPKDWDAFFDAAAHDPPHAEGVGIVRTIAEGHEIVYVTGRPERTREATVAWLERQGIGGHRLVMRPEGDRRPAAQVKSQLVARLARGRRIGIVVDDDAQVLAAMRAAGYPTFAADWEQRARDEAKALTAAQERDGRT